MGLKMNFKLVIFDLDGTIVENDYDWAAIRKELGIESGSILAYLESLPEPLRSEKYALLEAREKEQTEKSVLKKGIEKLLGWLKEKGMRIALVTNNSRENVNYLLRKFHLEFDYVLTRESGCHKPSAKPFLVVMEHFLVVPAETLVIGDTNYDLLAAKEAGISHIFILKNQRTPPDLKGAQIFSSVSDLLKFLKELLSC